MGSSESSSSDSNRKIEVNEVEIKADQTENSKMETKGIMTEMIEAICKSLKLKRESLITLNLMIIGKTGVGKSTLVNSLFKYNIAKSGIGHKTTYDITKYHKKNFPLAIYDCPGYELDSKYQKKVNDKIFEIIEEQSKKNDINESIHCILYCINNESKRFEVEEDKYIKNFTKDSRLGSIPVIMVITQSYDEEIAGEMKKEIERADLNIKGVVPVLAEDRIIRYGDQQNIYKSHGLEDLIQLLNKCLPDILKETLRSIQIVSIKNKRNGSIGAVCTAVAAAAAAGASPIPFSDCAILIPIEITMLTTITIIYGIDIEAGVLADVLGSIFGSGYLTLLGKFAVENILKMIPGAGTIIGAVICSSTASVLTAALGSAYIAVIEKIYKGEIDYDSLSRESFCNLISSKFKKFIKDKNILKKLKQANDSSQ